MISNRKKKKKITFGHPLKDEENGRKRTRTKREKRNKIIHSNSKKEGRNGKMNNISPTVLAHTRDPLQSLPKKDPAGVDALSKGHRSLPGESSSGR